MKASISSNPWAFSDFFVATLADKKTLFKNQTKKRSVFITAHLNTESLVNILLIFHGIKELEYDLEEALA